jgi:peroxiredoxin
VRSEIAASWAVKLGYRNVHQFPWGYHGWIEHTTGRSLKAQGMRPGDVFPDDRFTVLGGVADRDYLGLPLDARAMSLSEINTEYLLLELFDELCLTCQEEIEVLTDFYQRGGPARVGSLKVVGVMTGSPRRAAAKYRKQNRVPFPLVADEKRRLYHELGDPDLPATYLLFLSADGVLKVLSTHHRVFEDADVVEKELKQAVDGLERRAQAGP